MYFVTFVNYIILSESPNITQSISFMGPLDSSREIVGVWSYFCFNSVGYVVLSIPYYFNSTSLVCWFVLFCLLQTGDKLPQPVRPGQIKGFQFQLYSWRELFSPHKNREMIKIGKRSEVRRGKSLIF